MRGHVRPYGKRWAAVVYLGKEWNEEKKKYVKKYKWAYEDTEAEAEKALTRLLHQLDTHQYADPGKITVSEFITDTWWPEFSRTLEETTQDTYTTYITNHIKPIIGLIQWRSLRPFHLSNIFSAMTEKGLSGSTQQYVYAILKDIMHSAMMYTLITKESNPLDLVERPKTGKTEKRKAWPSTYVNRCLEHVAGTPMESAILLAITTGMRRGEIAGLQWHDIDWDNNQIYIRNSFARTKKGLTLKDPKSEYSKEPVMLLPPVRKHLEKMLTEQKKNMA